MKKEEKRERAESSPVTHRPRRIMSAGNEEPAPREDATPQEAQVTLVFAPDHVIYVLAGQAVLARVSRFVISVSNGPKSNGVTAAAAN